MSANNNRNPNKSIPEEVNADGLMSLTDSEDSSSSYAHIFDNQALVLELHELQKDQQQKGELPDNPLPEVKTRRLSKKRARRNPDQSPANLSSSSECLVLSTVQVDPVAEEYFDAQGSYDDFSAAEQESAGAPPAVQPAVQPAVPTTDTKPVPANMSLVASAFVSSKIVPDVIATAPTATLKVKYSSGVEAAQGNELTPTQVKDQPTVTYEGDADAFYTLVFTDPDNYDGPDPVYREWHHWLVGNIPGDNVAAGEVLSAYIGSGPPKGTGIHRYVYMLYKQPGKLSFDEARLTNKSINGRAGFSTKKFAEKYNLGAPVAGNFYRAQFDDYVPLLYKSLE